METVGRRLTMVISLIVGGVALLANAAVDLSGNGDVPFFTWFNLVRPAVVAEIVSALLFNHLR